MATYVKSFSLIMIMQEKKGMTRLWIKKNKKKKFTEKKTFPIKQATK
jgi:hypothetical protein